MRTTASATTDEQPTTAVGSQSAVATSGDNSADLQRLQQQVQDLKARLQIPTQPWVCMLVCCPAVALCRHHHQCSFRARLSHYIAPNSHWSVLVPALLFAFAAWGSSFNGVMSDSCSQVRQNDLGHWCRTNFGLALCSPYPEQHTGRQKTSCSILSTAIGLIVYSRRGTLATSSRRLRCSVQRNTA